MWVMDLFIIVTMTMFHSCVPIAETHSVEVISVCGTLPARPGMSKNPRQASNASKELGGESYPCATVQHQAAITVHLHTGPARLAWHLC